jgi:hypothetical protein
MVSSSVRYLDASNGFAFGMWLNEEARDACRRVAGLVLYVEMLGERHFEADA